MMSLLWCIFISFIVIFVATVVWVVVSAFIRYFLIGFFIALGAMFAYGALELFFKLAGH